jgi:hypothetical protein
VTQGDAAAACEATFPINQEEEAELENVRALNRCWELSGRGSAACSPASGVAAIKPVIAFCHNPVQKNDDRACGAPDKVTRPGDIRYHSINIWPTPENSSPWGFGPSWADPLTGEIIQASINVYNAVTDERAQRIVNKARWFAGELAARHPQRAVRPRSHSPRELGRQSRQFLMSKADIDRRLLRMADADPLALQTPRACARAEPGRRGVRAQERAPSRPRRPSGANAAAFTARIKRSEFSLRLSSSDPWYDAAGVDPATTKAPLELVSPLRRANARRCCKFRKPCSAVSENGVCLEADAPEPSSMPALGKLFDRKFRCVRSGRPAADQAARANRCGTTCAAGCTTACFSRMGHHRRAAQFHVSFDKFNYRPQYWQLRARFPETRPGRDDRVYRLVHGRGG